MKKYSQYYPQYQKGSVASLLITLVALIVAGVIVFGLRDVIRKSVPVNSNPNSSATSTSQSTSNSNWSALSIGQVMNVTLPDFIDTNPGDATFTLVNGKFDGSILQGTSKADDLSSYEVGLNTVSSSYAYGDLNGDGASDLVAIADASTGGTGMFTYLLSFTNKNGQPQYAASQFLGDRITVNNVTIQNGGIITVDMITQGPGEPMCCGTLRVIKQYSLKGGALTEVNSENQPGTDVNGNPLPKISSISPASGPIGTTITITGTSLAGFEGDLDAWIQNPSTGEVGFLPGIGSVPRADQTIRVTIAGQVCKTNNGYKGGPCDSFMSITPGTYSIYTEPWGNKSNAVKFTVTK